jgi:hypothetical protein
MSTFLTYQAAGLLFRNAGLLQCCCGSVEGLFWEGVPCPLTSDPKIACYNGDTCGYSNRVYFDAGSYCLGTDVTLCECQRLKIENFNLVTGGILTDVLTFNWSGGPGTSATVTLTAGVLTLSTSGYPDIVATITDYATLSALLGYLVSQNFVHASAWTFNTPTISQMDPRGLDDKTFTLNNGDTEGLDTFTTGIYFKYGTQADIFVELDPDPDIFIANLQTIFDATFGPVTVTKNVFNTGGSRFWAEIKFGDCGSPKNKVSLDYVIGQDITVEFAYGDDPRYTYLDGANKDYFVIDDVGNIVCPLEDESNNGPFNNPPGGCCPQKSTTLGPYQYIINSTGYYGVQGWANLETTIKQNGNCYSVSPGFFVAGMAGRLDYNQPYNKELHIAQGTGIQCVHELFLPLFHKDVPWGPFGSYFPGVEFQTHPAWLFPYNTNANPLTDGYRAFLSSGDAANFPRDGYSYRPYAELRSKGEWLSTKKLTLQGRVYKPIPYHVGDLPFDDASGTVSFKSSSISANINVTYPGGEGCGDFVIEFDCSGKTVADFVNAVNNLKIDGLVDDCAVFNFCLGSAEAGGLSADQIINVSSEIADHNIHTYEGVVGNPDADENLLSAAHVIMPKGYPYYFGQSAWNNNRYPTLGNGKPVIYYAETLTPLKNQQASSPPECRLTFGDLPKEGNFPVLREGFNHWFTNMNVSTMNTLAFKLRNDIDPTGFPNWSFGQSTSVSGKIYYYASGRAILSGFVDTNKLGATYTNQDCADEFNNISFTWASGTFNPFIATGITPYSIWYDDQTSETAGVYVYGTGNPTTFNYSYKEPISNSLTNQNILDSSGYVANRVRRRCNYGDSPSITGEPILPFCLPSNITTYEGTELDCAADEYVVGSFVLGFGCYSNNCITRWYFKTERCGCDKVWRCGEAGPVEVPHPLNQPANGLNTSTYSNFGNGLSVSQPTLYICEHNFHPECNIPMLVKVPFQVTNNLGLLDYQNGSVVELPAATEFCDTLNPFPSNAYGWCQYIDPINGVKVREEDIPRTDPPTAYVAERTRGSFCSTNIWNYDPRAIEPGAIPSAISFGATAMRLPDGCSEDSEACSIFETCASCESWDRICNIYALGDDYLIRYSDPSYLCALFRPIVQDLEARDVCAGTGLDRMDVDCSTACCECGFVCAVEGGPSITKVGNMWTQTFTYSHSYDVTTPFFCGYTTGDFACGVLIGCCLVDPSNLPCLPVQYCFGPPCVADCGNVVETYDISFTRDLSYCGCFPNNPACADNSFSGGGGGGGQGPCETTVLVAGDLPNTSTLCYSCDDIYLPDPISFSESFDSGVIPADGCGGCGGRPQIYFLFKREQGSRSAVASVTNNSCTGEYDYSYTYTESGSVTYSGDNSCSNSDVAFTGLGQNVEITHSITAKDWKVCNYTTIAGQTYNYITTWKENNLDYLCGEVGLSLGVSGTADPRFFGNYCGV